MFTMDETTIRWGDAARTSYAVRVKQEADPDYFDCAIIRDDPNPEFAAMFDAIAAGEYVVGDYQPGEGLPGMGTPLAPGASAAIVMPPRQIELWRVKRALRDIPATQAFRDYVASSGAEVRGSDGRVVAVENLSGLDQINVAISLTDNVSLQDFWRDGIYVYDSSPNFAAFAQILGLTPDAVDALVARANTFVV